LSLWSHRATAIAFSLWRVMRTPSVLSPRPRAYAACGSSTAPSTFRIAITRSTSGADPAITPAVTSLWPFRYLVALCITRSTPSAIGCWLTGDAKVLSRIDTQPASRHVRATAATSTQRSVGLMGDSNHTTFVRGPTRVAASVRSSGRTNRASMPKRGSTSARRRSVPP